MPPHLNCRPSKSNCKFGGQDINSIRTCPNILLQFGHMVLMSVFSAVDDTKLVSKAIIGEMAEAMADITSTQYGRKVSQLAFHL